LSVTEQCHSASTPLKSGIRIYRRLAVNAGSASPLIYSRRHRKQPVRETDALTEVDDGRGDRVKTDCNDARPENSGRVSRPAHDDKPAVSTERANYAHQYTLRASSVFTARRCASAIYAMTLCLSVSFCQNG